PPPGRPDPRSGARTPLPRRGARSCARWCGSSASLSVCGGAGQAIGLVGLVRGDHLLPPVTLDQRTIAARRISPSAAAAGDQPRDVTFPQPVARALSEDHLTAALMQDLHEIRGSGVTAGHAPRRKFEPAERGRQLCLIGDDPVVADQPASAAELPRAAAVHVERKLIDHDPVPRLGNLDGMTYVSPSPEHTSPLSPSLRAPAPQPPACGSTRMNRSPVSGCRPEITVPHTLRKCPAVRRSGSTAARAFHTRSMA